MPECTPAPIEFTRSKRRKVVADFGGGGITSDAGVPLLGEADKRLPLIERIAAQCDAPRCKGKCAYSLQNMLPQRIYAMAMGYENLNDHTKAK